MKKFLPHFILLSIMFCLNCTAQIADWIKPLSLDSFDSKATSVGWRNNTHYLSGSFSGNLRDTFYSHGGRDIFIYTYSYTTYTSKIVTAGGSGDDEALSIFVDPSNGSCYITGYYSGMAFFGNDTLFSAGGEDVFLAKYSSSGAFQWAQSYGGPGDDRGLSVGLQGSNVIVCGQYTGVMTYDSLGNTITSNGSDDGFLFSASSSNGNISWITTMGGPSSDATLGVTVTTAGEIYAAGRFNSTATFSTTNIVSAGMDDGFVARYTNTGTLTWVVPIGSALGDTCFSVTTASASANPCITGSFADTIYAGADTLVSLGGSDCFVMYINAASGGVIWARSHGGPGYDAGYGIAGDNMFVFVTGATNDTLHFGSTISNPYGGADGYVGRYDLPGNAGWVKRGNSPYNHENIGLFQSGSYLYCAGYVFDSLNLSPAAVWTIGCSGIGYRLLKTTGASDQQQVLGSLATVGTYFDAISIGENKNAYAIGGIIGEFDYDTQIVANTPAYASYCVIKLDSNGTFIWKKQIIPDAPGETANIFRIEALSTGGFIGAGTYSSAVKLSPTVTVTNVSGTPGIWIAKFDANGDVIWAKTAAHGNGQSLTDICVDSAGKVYVIGTFSSNYFFIDGVHSVSQGTAQTAGFIARFDANGVCEWWHGFSSYNGSITIAMSNICADGSGNMIFSGSYYGQTGLDDLNLTSYDDISFLAKISPAGTVIWTKVITGNSSSFGNSRDHIRCDPADNIFFYFAFYDTARLSPSMLLTDPGSDDLALVKYDPQGNYLWSVHISGPLYNAGFGDLQLTGNGEPMIVGSHNSNITYNSVSMNYLPNTNVTHIIKFDVAGNILSDTILAYGNAPCYSFDLSGDYLVFQGHVIPYGDTVCGLWIPGYNGQSYLPWFGGMHHNTCSPPVAQYTYTDNTFGLFTFSNTFPATQYTWDFGDGNFSSQSNPSHQYANTGVYNVCLVATNSCGGDSVCQSVNCLITGSADNEAGSLFMHPNPVTTNLELALPATTNKERTINIYETDGSLCYSITTSNAKQQVSIDVEKWSSGIYFLQVNDGVSSASYTFIKTN